jgi:hypothetical protein
MQVYFLDLPKKHINTFLSYTAIYRNLSKLRIESMIDKES